VDDPFVSFNSSSSIALEPVIELVIAAALMLLLLFHPSLALEDDANSETDGCPTETEL
jgi:hypothetical protein